MARDPHFIDRSSWPRCRRFVRRSRFFPTPSKRSHASRQTRCPDWCAKQIQGFEFAPLEIGGMLKEFSWSFLGIPQLKSKSHEPSLSTWGPTFNIIVTFPSLTIRNLQWPEFDRHQNAKQIFIISASGAEHLQLHVGCRTACFTRSLSIPFFAKTVSSVSFSWSKLFVAKPWNDSSLARVKLIFTGSRVTPFSEVELVLGVQRHKWTLYTISWFHHFSP